MSAGARFAPRARADIARAPGFHGESPAVMRRLQSALAAPLRHLDTFRMPGYGLVPPTRHLLSNQAVAA